MYKIFFLCFVVKSTALSQLNGDSSGSGSGDGETSNRNTTLNNSTAGEEDETSHENAPKNQTEGIHSCCNCSQTAIILLTKFSQKSVPKYKPTHKNIPKVWNTFLKKFGEE